MRAFVVVDDDKTSKIKSKAYLNATRSGPLFGLLELNISYRPKSL